MDPAKVKPAVQISVAELAKTDPRLTSVRFSDLMKSVGDRLGVTAEHTKPLRDDVERYAKTAIQEMLNEAPDGPVTLIPQPALHTAMEQAVISTIAGFAEIDPKLK